MQSSSIYQFGGQEHHALELQKRFIPFFHNVQGPIVDLGCGRGMFLAELESRGYRAVGVDGSAESVEICHQRGLEIVHADILDYLSTQQNCFGGIFLSHVVEHFTPEQARNFLSMARNALEPGGRLIVVTPNVSDLWTMTELFWLDMTHVRPYPLLLLKELCNEAGIQVVATGTHGLGWRAMGRRRIFQYGWRKVVWGRQYGRTDAWIVAQR